MYTIKEICSGASKLVRSMLSKKREYRLQFNKEKNGCWYVDFPHWPFSHDNLAMVSGADKMLELLSDGDLLVKVSVIPTNKQQQHEGYIELRQTEHSLLGGSTYQVMYEQFVNRFKRDTLWICPVTLFVLGRYPKYIYVKKLVYDMPPSSKPDLYELATHTEKYIFAMCGFSVFRLKGRDLYVGMVTNEVKCLDVKHIDDVDVIYETSLFAVEKLLNQAEPIRRNIFEELWNKQTILSQYISSRINSDNLFCLICDTGENTVYAEFQNEHINRTLFWFDKKNVVAGNFEDTKSNFDLLIESVRINGNVRESIISREEFESIWKNRYQVPINIGYPQLDPLFKNAANIIVQKQLNDIRTVGKYLGIDNLHRVEHLIRQLEIFGIVQQESFFAINPIKSKERLVEIFLEKKIIDLPPKEEASMPYTEYIRNYKLKKGDVIYECHHNHVWRVRILTVPVTSIVHDGGRDYTAWDWDAEVLDVHDYSWDGFEWNKKKILNHRNHIHYRVSEVPCQGGPNLYLEDIYQYKIGAKMDIVHYICTPLA